MQAPARHGRRSIFVVDPGDKNARVVFETLTEYGAASPSCSVTSRNRVTGDSRILLVDGEPGHALARMPAATDNRGNLAAGATGERRPLNDRDR